MSKIELIIIINISKKIGINIIKYLFKTFSPKFAKDIVELLTSNFCIFKLKYVLI